MNWKHAHINIFKVTIPQTGATVTAIIENGKLAENLVFTLSDMSVMYKSLRASKSNYVMHLCLVVPFGWENMMSAVLLLYNNNNNSYIALYPVQIYKLVVLYIISIKICLTIKKVQVL